MRALPSLLPKMVDAICSAKRVSFGDVVLSLLGTYSDADGASDELCE